MNILVHQHTIKLADFGISRELQKSVHYTKNLFGMPPYVDPKTFQKTTDKESCPYKLTKKSDIYSLGVLFWELTSRLPPFNNFKHDVGLQLDILGGTRETPVPNTNPKFVKLYQSE